MVIIEEEAEIVRLIYDLYLKGLKYRIIELYAIIETSYNNEIGYDSVINMNFGTAIQNILNKNIFIQILKPEPISIRLSDWRNIAYHHTYEIEGRREIHCIQFLYNIWIEFPVQNINIIYCDSMGRTLYEYSTKGEICQEIANGILEFVNLFGFISIKKLSN